MTPHASQTGKTNSRYHVAGMSGPLGSGVGNIVSGLIAEYTNWRWVFFVTSLIALTTMAGGLFIIPKGLRQNVTTSHAFTSGSKLNQTMRLDWAGAFLWATGALSLLLAITEAGVTGLQTTWVPLFIGIGLILIIGFFFWEAFVERRELRSLSEGGGGVAKDSRPPKVPLVRLSNFRGKPPLIAGVVVLFFVVASFNGYLNMTATYFHTYQALDPLDTALRFIPAAVVGFCTIGSVTQLLGRISIFSILATGAIAVAIANLVMAMPISSRASYFAYNLPTMITAAFGVECMMITLSLYTYVKVEDKTSLEEGMLVMIAQLGRAFGVAITTAVRIAVVRYDGVASGELQFGTQASLDGVKSAFWTNSWFAWLAIWVILILMRKEGPLNGGK